MNSFSLVMFDYDGVIVDSLDLFTSVFISSCRDNGFLEVSTREDMMALFEENVYTAMSHYGLSAETIDNILKTFESRSTKYSDQLKLFNGMGDALKKISESSKVFIITSNVSGIPERVLQRNGITCYEEVIGADKEKSKIKKIRKTIEQYPLLCPYYVGDTKGDIIEGKTAEARTVGVAWGWHGADRLREANPDYLVYNPEELTALLCSRPEQAGPINT